MSLKLIFSANADQSDIQLCEDYWAYGNDGRYVEHIEVLCRRYYIDYHILFGVLAECQAYGVFQGSCHHQAKLSGL